MRLPSLPALIALSFVGAVAPVALGAGVAHAVVTYQDKAATQAWASKVWTVSAPLYELVVYVDGNAYVEDSGLTLDYCKQVAATLDHYTGVDGAWVMLTGNEVIECE